MEEKQKDTQPADYYASAETNKMILPAIAAPPKEKKLKAKVKKPPTLARDASLPRGAINKNNHVSSMTPAARRQSNAKEKSPMALYKPVPHEQHLRKNSLKIAQNNNKLGVAEKRQQNNKNQE